MRRIALAGLVLLGACSLNEALETKIDYKSASTLPPLEVPPDLTSPQRDGRYVLPEGRQTATLSGYEAERKDQTRQGNASVLPQLEQMRIERAGSERWLVVPESAEKVWPLVKEFWQENGFLIKLEIPEAGVMETDWAENRAKIPDGYIKDFLGKLFDSLYSTSERDKYRTRLERTPDGKGTEVYISHRGMVELYKEQLTKQETMWQPRPADPGLEAEFLRRMMVRLGMQDDKARAALAAPVPAQRAEIRKANDGTELLQVNEPFDRAWRRVGLALDRVGFTVEDRDRQKGLYFVRYADPDVEMGGKSNEKGLFSGLSDWITKDSKVKPEQYRVQVVQDQGTSQVNVLNKDGTAENSKTASRILTLLHEQLK